MNSNEKANNFELPSVLPEVTNDTYADSVKGVESLPAKPETYVNPATPSLSNVKPVSDDQDNGSPAGDNVPTTSTSTQTSGSFPQIADDNDLIEKEWIIKAKQIVSATKDDPYKQNREISKFKADYIQKRYGKNIKIEET